jgi:uncharacterized membrane protein
MNRHRPLIIATLVAFVIIATLDVLRWNFWSYGADSGTFAQLITDTFGGMRDGIERGTHFRFHWSPVLALLWPLMTATHQVLALQFVQIAATVAVAPLAYALVEPRAGKRAALLLAILTLVYPPLLAIGWGEFHEVGLFAPLALGLVVSADRKAWGWFAVCAVLACGIREDTTLELAIVGVALAIAGWRSRLAWTLLAVLAIASDTFYYAVIVPRVGPWNPAHFYAYPFAAGPLALMVAPLTHPVQFAREFFTFGRLTYLLEAFAPLAFLPLFSRWSLLALPGFAIVLLANDPLVYHMGNHYSSLWSPWLIVGAAFAVAEQRSVRWTQVAIALSVIFLAFFNPLHPAHFLKPNYHDLGAARRAFTCLPHDASVSTHDEWFTRLAAQDANATLGTITGVDYLVFADDYPNDEFQRVWLPKIHAEVASGAYHQVCRFDDVVVYERGRP